MVILRADTAMIFMLAGKVSSKPAAIAVWAFVKPRVFEAYIPYGICEATAARLSWQMIV